MSDVDSIEAEAEACIAEIDALLTEACKNGLNPGLLPGTRQPNVPWFLLPSVSSLSGLYIALLYSISLALASTSVDSLQAYGSQWPLPCCIILCLCTTAATLMFLRGSKRIEFAVSKGTPHKTRLFVFVMAMLIPAVVGSLVRAGRSNGDNIMLRTLPFTVPLFVAVLQPVFLGWNRELMVFPGVVAMCVGGLWSREGDSFGSMDSMLLGLCTVGVCGVSLVMARWASDRTGLNECGLMWYLCWASAPPLGVYALMAEDIGALPSSGLWGDPQFVGNMLAVVVLGTVQLYTLFLCLTVNSPLAVAVAGAAKETGLLVYVLTSGAPAGGQGPAGAVWSGVAITLCGLGLHLFQSYRLQAAEPEHGYSLVLPS